MSSFGRGRVQVKADHHLWDELVTLCTGNSFHGGFTRQNNAAAETTLSRNA